MLMTNQTIVSSPAVFGAAVRQFHRPLMVALFCLALTACTVGSSDSTTPTPDTDRSTVTTADQPTTEVLGSTIDRPDLPGLRQIFVSPDTTTPGDGSTPDRPLSSLAQAVTKLVPGDTVVLMDGIYDEKMQSNQHYSFEANGTPDRWITIMNYPGHQPIVRALNGSAFEIIGSYVTVEGLTIEGGGEQRTASYGYGVLVSGHHFKILDNTVSGMPGSGIGAAYASHFWVEGNVVHHNAYWAPEQASGISTWLLTDGGGDLYFDGYSTRIVNNIVYGNEVRVTNSAGNKTDGNGIILDFGNERGHTLPILVANNLVVDNGGAGILALNTQNVDVFNNTLYQNGKTRDLQSGGAELAAALGASNVRFGNNIVIARPDVPVIAYDRGEGTSTNNLFVEGNPSTSRTSDQDRAVDLADLFVSPGLDPTTSDFRLRAGSPAIDAGTQPPPIPSTDVYGGERFVGPSIDVGAIESATSAPATEAPRTPQTTTTTSAPTTTTMQPTTTESAREATTTVSADDAGEQATGNRQDDVTATSQASDIEPNLEQSTLAPSTSSTTPTTAATQEQSSAEAEDHQSSTPSTTVSTGADDPRSAPAALSPDAEAAVPQMQTDPSEITTVPTTGDAAADGVQPVTPNETSTTTSPSASTSNPIELPTTSLAPIAPESAIDPDTLPPSQLAFIETTGGGGTDRNKGLPVIPMIAVGLVGLGSLAFRRFDPVSDHGRRRHQ